MKEVSIIVGFRPFVDMTNHINETFQSMSLLNGMNGDEVTLEPDVPGKGFMTIRIMNQLEGDDD